MSVETNKALIRRLYDEGINRQNAAAAAAFYATDAKNHGRQVGRAGMQAVFEALFRHEALHRFDFSAFIGG